MKKRPTKRPTQPDHDREAELAALTATFETPEFAHHSKNELWYVGIGLLLLVGIVWTLDAADYLFTAVILAAGLAIFRIAQARPESRRVVINPFGVRWGDRTFGYHQFKAFWASENTGKLVVYLERPNFASVIHFAVPDDQAEKVLTFLSLELPFHYHKDEPLGDRLARALRI